MRDCGFKHSYGKLLTVAPCRTLFYKIVLICIRCINKKNQILKNATLDKCGIIKLEK